MGKSKLIFVVLAFFMFVSTLTAFAEANEKINITYFEELSKEIRSQELYVGDSYEKINLPETLEGKDDKGNNITIENIKWQGNIIFNTNISGTYVYTPILEDKYNVVSEIPSIEIKVKKITTLISKAYGLNNNYFDVTTKGIIENRDTVITTYVKNGTKEYSFISKLQSDGSYKATINISKWNYARGKYLVKILKKDEYGSKQIYSGSIAFSFMTSSYLQIGSTTKKTTTFPITVGKINSQSGVKSIKIKVTLGKLTRWYKTQYVGGGKYTAYINRRHFQYKKGNYKMYAYGYDKNNVSKLLSSRSKNFTSEAWKLFYINGTLVVNKKHKLPSNYNPGESKTARTAFIKMRNTMISKGYNVGFKYSGFRSYQYQAWLYNYWVSVDGKKMADKESARAGYSEHQTGLAFDLMNKSEGRLNSTKETKWISENAYKYGFIVRYPKGKTSITGYIYEPWHLRYVGVQKATAIKSSGKTLEEFLKVSGGGYR